MHCIQGKQKYHVHKTNMGVQAYGCVILRVAVIITRVGGGVYTSICMYVLFTLSVICVAVRAQYYHKSKKCPCYR